MKRFSFSHSARPFFPPTYRGALHRDRIAACSAEMAAARRRREAHGDAPASTADVRLGESPSHKPSRDRRGRETLVETRDTEKPSAKKRQAAKRVRVYVLTYFFSSLTIDRWRGLFGLVPVGWIFSSLAEWLGVPICHTNVQVSDERHRPIGTGNPRLRRGDGVTSTLTRHLANMDSSAHRSRLPTDPERG